MSTTAYTDCIQACSACAIACETCAAACQREPDIEHLRTCMALNLDCIDLCRLAERLMQRESALVDEICRLCALACQACAEECAKHTHDHCQQCAEACQRCVAACEAIGLAA